MRAPACLAVLILAAGAPAAPAAGPVPTATATATPGPQPSLQPSPQPSPEPSPEPPYQGSAVVVRARRLPPQVSERVLRAEEARRVPGAAGDIVRALAALPGAVTPNDFLANLLVRGGGFDDNLVLLDGLPVPYPFHFGGLESVFHPGALDEAVFLPGAFDARFGDTLGGVLDLRTRRPEPGLEGELGLSLLQASALLSHGVPSVRAQAAYRRGWFDLVLPDNPAFIGLPRWQDHLVQVDWDALGGRGGLRSFGSRDALVARGGPGSVDSRFESAFEVLGLQWRAGPGPWRPELRTWGSYAEITVDLGPDLNLRRAPYTFGAALELDGRPADDHLLNLGVQWELHSTGLQGTFARLPVELGTGVDFNALSRTAVDALGRKAVTGVWAQDRWLLLPAAAMSLGVRFDHVAPAQEYHFSPRWSLELGPFGATKIWLGVGDYFQSPAGLETVPGWSAGGARSSLVRSYTAGLSQGLGRAELRVEAYHKDFERRIPEFAVSGGTGNSSTVVLNAVGTGVAEGVEALLRLPSVGRLGGWLSYAWSDTRRGDPVRGYHAADFSQPHVGNLVLELELPRGWILGGRYRAASGIPYTPVASRSFDAGTGRWVPAFGPPNSGRLEPYQRLDLRLEKRWEPREPGGWDRVTVFAELFNALDAENVTSVTYEDDYSGIRRIRQFPRLIFGGLELAF